VTFFSAPVERRSSVARTEKAKVAAEVPRDRFQALRQRLQNQRAEIINMYKQDLRAGQESADDGTEDIVDRANNAYNRELMFSLSDNERATLLQIENALARMDEGSYGRCANCGQTINVLRLEAVPWARFCVDCQELAEKGLLEVEAS
jgi:RNA polymerase-binding transcription factor